MLPSSYALSQALTQPQFLQSFITFHSHFLILPLVQALSAFNDAAIAGQIVDLILQMCEASRDADVCGDFIAQLPDRLSLYSLAWGRQQLQIGKLKDEEAAALGVATGMILSLRESLQNCKDTLGTCQLLIKILLVFFFLVFLLAFLLLIYFNVVAKILYLSEELALMIEFMSEHTPILRGSISITVFQVACVAWPLI